MVPDWAVSELAHNHCSRIDIGHCLKKWQKLELKKDIDRFGHKTHDSHEDCLDAVVVVGKITDRVADAVAVAANMYPAV